MQAKGLSLVVILRWIELTVPRRIFDFGYTLTKHGIFYIIHIEINHQ